MTTKLFWFLFLISAVALQLNSQTRTVIYDKYQSFLSTSNNMTYGQLRLATPRVNYQSNLNYDTTAIVYFDTISSKFQLTPYEKQLIIQNGFMVTDRKRWESFGSVTKDIYHKDLPMFISTDMMLHVVHKSYDNILLETEGGFLIDKSKLLLDEMAAKIPAMHSQYSGYADFQQPLKDLDYYLTVARKLFTPSVNPYYPANNGRIDTTLGWIASYAVPLTNLFGEEDHFIDFSQFKVRGHYADSVNQMQFPLIDEYFRVMIWLGRTEIPLLKEDGTPMKRTIILSALLADMLKTVSIYGKYSDIDKVITSFVGDQDNLTVPNFNVLLSKCGITDLLSLQNTAVINQFKDSLVNNPLAFQRIVSQILLSNPFDSTIVPPAVAIMLFGQRFIPDSYITSQVVYDRILYNGVKQRRMLPSSLDVLYGLGNNHALEYIRPEIEHWNYAKNIASVRYLISNYEPQFWDTSLFNIWLNGIRRLNPPEQTAILPPFMRTNAYWNNKMNTQLGSWIELRHDNILYAKQSYSSGWICSYPLSYVEPVPELYYSLGRFGRKLAEVIAPLDMNSYYKSKMMSFGNYLYNVCDTLRNISIKELLGEQLSNSEKMFLRGMIKFEMGYSSSYTGWYYNLHYNADVNFFKKDFIVADYHTAAFDTNFVWVGNVKHGGTGSINLGVYVVPYPDSQLYAYAGPAYSYYEYTSTNMLRLADAEWAGQYMAQSARPGFVSNYLANQYGLPWVADNNLVSYRDNGQIEEFRLLNNYPNPFNSSTIIAFDIASVAELKNVEINIYDIQGNLVKRLANDVLSPGRHYINWKGNNDANNPVASGIYLYRIKYGDKQYLGKMNLLK